MLKAGREKSLLQRHPWIFLGAVEFFPEDVKEGEILPVYSFSGQFLAQAYFQANHSLSGRILGFDNGSVYETIKSHMKKALVMREALFNPKETNAYRLINAEGDGIPGLIVDRYHDVLVVQINTRGLEDLKPFIIDSLIEVFHPRAIYEKSTSHGREQEGLKKSEGFLFGKEIDQIVILENSIKFAISLKEGQKTGFFLDQREMRSFLSKLSVGKSILNCFSYTGGFSIYALKAGATLVKSVDCCQKVLSLAQKNTELNELSPSKHQLIEADVFEYLKSASIDEDIVILDPPAFAKKRSSVIQASRGYKEINRRAFEKMKPGSILVTCSCSAHIDLPLFQNLIFQAALEAKRDVKIIKKHILASDHPISIYHPEGEYLKSLVLYIE